MSDSKMKELRFSYNWNNKLDCKAFTTLRLSNRFSVGQKVEVFLKKELLLKAEIVGKKSFLLKDINDFIAYVDTGYNAKECQDILRRMYSNSDWEYTKLYFYLIKVTERIIN